MKRRYFLYVLRSASGVLYIGVTNNLEKRVWEHRIGVVEGFTKKYHVDKLIYYEEYANPLEAIAREKQLKNWSRSKKLQLVGKKNPMLVELRFDG